MSDERADGASLASAFISEMMKRFDLGDDHRAFRRH